LQLEAETLESVELPAPLCESVEQSFYQQYMTETSAAEQQAEVSQCVNYLKLDRQHTMHRFEIFKAPCP